MARQGFKVGDWVIHGFNISMVKRVEDGRVTEASDGISSTSGYDLQCAPLTLRNKQIADTIDYWYQKWHSENYPANWPDLTRALEDMAQAAMATEDMGEDNSKNESLVAAMKKIGDFCGKANEMLLQSRNAVVDGVRLFSGRR